MKGKRRTPRDKILIVLEFLETDIKISDLCRKHNITPTAFSRWKTRFIDGGKKAVESKGVPEILRHRRETDKLKGIIAEQTIVIEELKKLWRDRNKDDPRQANTTDVRKKGTILPWRILQHAILPKRAQKETDVP